MLYRSQLSVCSEPANIPVYQLSIDQSLVEEMPKQSTPPLSPNTSSYTTQKSIFLRAISDEQSMQIKRPTSLVLACNRVEATNTITTITEDNKNEEQLNKTEKSNQKSQKHLYRSNSSSLHKRPSTFVPSATSSENNKFKLSSELDKIFVISSNNRSSNLDDDNYNSIEVIDERRMKNMPKTDHARLYKSNTFICEEYYTNEQLAGMIEEKSTEVVVEAKPGNIVTEIIAEVVAEEKNE